MRMLTGIAMATGITKREQHSPDAISAFELSGEPLPLPDNGAVSELSYPNKAPVEAIVRNFPRKFVQFTKTVENAVKEIPENAFILADNFFVLSRLLHEKKKVTLFYLDPPYGTGFGFHSRNLEHAYNDKMGQAAYLEFMRRRLILMRECMADDGAIYVHIGHKMLAHLKILMDEVFGPENFRNLVTRRKCSSKNFTRKQYANLNDYILFYSKSRRYKWNQPGIEPAQAWVEKEYPKLDKFGRRFKLVPLHAPGTRNGETGKDWRGMLPPPGKHWQYLPSKLDEFDRRGDIHWSRNGNPRRKIYWESDKKMALTDYWDKYRDAHHQSIRITGYPTEKNLEMLKVIVRASSEPGDLVIDPFCGSGTMLHAARDLGRRYIGVDASLSAAKATMRRMRYDMERMGDYVNGKKPNSVDVPTVEFDQTSQPCTFVSDGCLLDFCSEKIREIGSI